MLSPGLLLCGNRRAGSDSCLLCTCQCCCPVQGKSRVVAFCQVSWKSLQEIEIFVSPAALYVGIQTEVMPSCAELVCKVHHQLQIVLHGDVLLTNLFVRI